MTQNKNASGYKFDIRRVEGYAESIRSMFVKMQKLHSPLPIKGQKQT